MSPERDARKAQSTIKLTLKVKEGHEPKHSRPGTRLVGGIQACQYFDFSFFNETILDLLTSRSVR